MGYNVEAQAALEAKIRLRCGSPDTTLLTAAELTECLTSALATLNRFDPRLQFSSITTVALQQDYRVAGPDYGLTSFRAVTKVLWEDTLAGYSAMLDGYLSAPELVGSFLPIADGLSIFDNPALVNIYYSKALQYEQAFGGNGFEIQKTDGTYIRLLPCPSSADTTVPFFWKQNRTLTDLEERFEEPLVKLAAGHCKLIVGGRLNEVPKVDHGHRKTESNGDSAIKSGNEWIAEAELDMYKPTHGSSL